MNCPRCGTEQRTQARFCANCGAPMPVAPTEIQPSYQPPIQPTYTPPPQQSYPPPAPTPLYSPPQQPSYPPAEPPPIYSSSGTGKSKRLWLIIAAAAVGLIALGVLAAVVLNQIINFPEKVVEEGIKVISTQVGDMVTQISTMIPTFDITIELPTSLKDLTEGTKQPFGSLGETLMPFFDDKTPEPGTQVIEWNGHGGNYRVEIKDSKVVAGSGQDDYKWEAISGDFDGELLVVTFRTTQQSGCASEISYTYEVQERRLELLHSIDKCGKLTNYTDRYYIRKQ